MCYSMSLSGHKVRLSTVSFMSVCVPGVMGEREDGDQGYSRPAKAGDHVRLTFKVSNERNSPLSDFCVKDDNLGDGCLDCVEPETTATTPGSDFVCYVDYEVTRTRETPGPRAMICRAVDLSGQIHS